MPYRTAEAGSEPESSHHERLEFAAWVSLVFTVVVMLVASMVALQWIADRHNPLVAWALAVGIMVGITAALFWFLSRAKR